MDQQILTKCINELKKVVGESRSQLDIGAMKELDDAISTLEKLLDHPQSAADVATRKLRIFQAIAAFVSITTNIRDWL